MDRGNRLLKNLQNGAALLASLAFSSSGMGQSVSPFPQVASPKTGIFTILQPALPTAAPADAPVVSVAANDKPAEKSEKNWKPVKVPLPPQIDPKLRATPAAPAAAANEPAKEPVKEPAQLSDTKEAKPAETAAEKPTEKPADVAALPAGWKQVNLPLPPRLDKKLRVLAAKADKEKAEKAKADKAAAAQAKLEQSTAEQQKTDQASLDPSKAAPQAQPEPTPQAAPQPAPAPPKDTKASRRKNGKLDDLTRAAPAAEPVAPTRATGIFSLFDKQLSAAEQAEPQGDSARLVMPDNASAFAPAPGRRRTASLGLLSPIKPRRGNSDLRDDDLEDEEGGAGVSLEKQVSSVQTACLKSSLVAMLKQTGEHFGGTPIITSGYRNRGRRGSLHRRCEAADFQIAGVSSSQIVAYLRALPGAGGVGTYCHTKSVHLDVGTPRNWHQCGFHRSFSLRTPAVANAQ